MKYLLLLLCPSFLFASCDVDDAIQAIRPGAGYMIQQNNLIWLDTSTVKPTLLEIQSAASDCRAAAVARAAAKRQARLDVKNTGLTQAQRMTALLILLDYDQ